MFAYDSQAPLDVQEVGRRRKEGVTVIDLTYASPMGGRAPATLVVPDGAGPFAGLLYQHGIPGTRRYWIPVGVTYARMGAVVLLIDAPFAGWPTRNDRLRRPLSCRLPCGPPRVHRAALPALSVQRNLRGQIPRPDHNLEGCGPSASSLC